MASSQSATLKRTTPAMNIEQINRTRVTINANGRERQADRLDLALPFARKPKDLQAVIDGLYNSLPCGIYVERQLVLSPEDFDSFAANFFAQQPWLDPAQGGGHNDFMLCVQVSAPGRPVLFVNSEGYGYARQVALLP